MSGVDTFTLPWMGVGVFVVALAIWLAAMDRGRTRRYVDLVEENVSSQRKQLEEVLSMQAKQVAFLDRLEELIQRAERLLDRIEGQFRITPAADKGRPLDTSAITATRNP